MASELQKKKNSEIPVVKKIVVTGIFYCTLQQQDFENFVLSSAEKLYETKSSCFSIVWNLYEVY